jgi:hypothetical protein
MYVTALLLFNIISLQFQTLFVVVHKLHDSMGEEGYMLLPHPSVLRFFHFIFSQTDDNLVPLYVDQKRESCTVRIMDCKVDVAEPRT